MVPQVLLGCVLRELGEVERCYVFLVPPFCSIIALLLSIPVPGVGPTGILSQSHFVTRFSLSSSPNSLPPNVSLSTHSLTIFFTSRSNIDKWNIILPIYKGRTRLQRNTWLRRYSWRLKQVRQMIKPIMTHQSLKKNFFRNLRFNHAIGGMKFKENWVIFTELTDTKKVFCASLL